MPHVGWHSCRHACCYLRFLCKHNNPCSFTEGATLRKDKKYFEIEQSHDFVPLAIETLARPYKFQGTEIPFCIGWVTLSCCHSDPPSRTSFLFQLWYAPLHRVANSRISSPGCKQCNEIMSFTYFCLKLHTAFQCYFLPRNFHRRDRILATPETVFNMLLTTGDIYYQGF